MEVYRSIDRIISLYTNYGFHIELANAPRAVAANGNREKVKEMIAYNTLR
jgi:hypothetical protein